MTDNLLLDFLVGICIYVPSYAVGVLAHEGGHLLAACLFDLGPRVLDLGVGRVFLRGRIGRVRVVVRPVPLGGIVMTRPIYGRPSARAALYAAGATVNLGLLATCVACALWAPAPPDLAIYAGIAQTMILARVLWPRHGMLNGRRVASDGLQLLRVMFRHTTNQMEATQSFLMRPHLAPGSPVPPASRHMPEIVFQVTRPDRNLESWAARDAQDAMRALLNEPDLPPAERTLVLTFLVDTALCLDPVGTTAEELDAWSREVLNCSHHAHARVMRGGVLATLGRFEEALATLRPFLAAGLAEQDRLLVRAFMGQAEAARGAVEAAKLLFTSARKLPSARTGIMRQVLDRLENGSMAEEVG